jgi:hypothetical protein
VDSTKGFMSGRDEIERGHALSIGNFAEGRVEEESSKDGS